ncbi:hypothetical protein [Streptomyces sp. DH24]|uniref:hypothetical protein n=1 Tax=Streptomyces sp. DH24 TaxID=3040123 RepID=UPI0024430CFA|nr:hypothetical protein [Streptomyces sp. DH24]MDG9719618.1 hypothetical protein [Streptomyces sp. DH24]
MTDNEQDRKPSPDDARIVERLVPIWLEETQRHDPDAAHRARDGWREGSLPPDSARDLAHWVTARITDTAFNEDEGPDVNGPARITPADKSAVLRWLDDHGHTV